MRNSAQIRVSRRRRYRALAQILIQPVHRPRGMHIVSMDDSIGVFPSPSSKLLRSYAPSQFFRTHRIHNKPDILLEEQRKTFQQLAGQFQVPVLENMAEALIILSRNESVISCSDSPERAHLIAVPARSRHHARAELLKRLTTRCKISCADTFPSGALLSATERQNSPSPPLLSSSSSPGNCAKVFWIRSP